MYRPRNPREEGSAFVYVLVCLVALLSLTAASSAITLTNQKATSESSRTMRATYLADTGAQIGSFLVRASIATMPATTWTETLCGGSVDIAVTPVTASLHRVESTGNFQGELAAVEIHIESIETLNMEGALQVTFGDGVEVEPATINFELHGAATVSGQDHDAYGNLIADQTEATYGVAMSPVPGAPTVDVYVDVSGGADLEGSPTPTANDVGAQSALVANLAAYAAANADVTIVGDATLNNASSGSFGTAASPVLTYVSLGDNEQLHVRQNFEGWGTLVIEVDRATTTTPVYMEDSIRWHGLVVVRFKGEADIPSSPLIELDNFAQIIGGLLVDFAAEGTTFSGDSPVFDAGNGNAGVYFSSEVLSIADGVDQAVAASVRVLSYRHVQP